MGKLFAVNLFPTFRNSDKYDKDKKRSQDIGNILKQKINEIGFNSVVQSFAEKTGLKIITVGSYIKSYCYGNFVVQCSSASSRGYVENSGKYLRRLAILYDILAIKKDDKIIELSKEINPKFEYPPCEEIDYKCAVNVHFSHDTLQLDEKQLGHLERLALNYAKKNLER